MKDYMTFLESKRDVVKPVGFDVADEAINHQLFDWQRRIVQWDAEHRRITAHDDLFAHAEKEAS